MGLIDFNPVGWVEAAKNAGYERNVVNVLLSGAISAWLAAMWGLGQKKFFGFAADAATAAFLSMRQLEAKNLLTLTVPTKLLDAANLSRFQTEEMSK